MQAYHTPADLAKAVPAMRKAESAAPRGHAAQDEMLLCLCAACAQQFSDSPAHRIRRADRRQRYKDSCDYCSCRFGWDYIILNAEKIGRPQASCILTPCRKE